MSDREESGGAATTSTDRRPVGVVVASAIEGFRTLARQHLELAKIEVVEAASIRGQGVGMMAAAAVVVMYAIGFLAAAGAAALALIWPVWASILTVAVVMAVVAWVLVLVGRRTIRTAPPPVTRTKETLKGDARWAQRQIER
ncbi:MAG TPA: phage holin family protein [Actinomycetota bacterium]|nr:phage holin family protein [Actinomycetota bacterium]